MKQTEIAQLLPAIFQRTLQAGKPLNALLAVMEALHAPSEQVLMERERYFNPRYTPDQFVAFLAHWVNLGHLVDAAASPSHSSLHTPLIALGHLRELIAAATYLSQWRGTAKGLRLFLEIATGVRGFDLNDNVLDSQGQPKPFHLQVIAPSAAQPQRALIKEIIEMEKPAYVTYELVFGETS
ncbi:MAG: hypothetical protein DRR08_07225 [Candidatus Parabeggiatoa sp. nov. 2]|nr:MAG: hypothetical protein B6247_09270 [Beggiatoa sp. 4572_84]RKZ62017.1 MAG: hypothetical protein DRR08_07225 [Gammaproteobacteria bacterium]